MALNLPALEQAAILAKIYLNEKEKEVYLEQLNALLECVDILQEVNTDDVEPLIHILPTYNVFRSDEVKDSLGQEEILAQATSVEDGHFKVPRIME